MNRLRITVLIEKVTLLKDPPRDQAELVAKVVEETVVSPDLAITSALKRAKKKLSDMRPDESEG